MLAPVDKAESALVSSNIFQGGNNIDLKSSLINYTFTNNDIGAIYNSATLDLQSVLGGVVDSIVAKNTLGLSAADVYQNMSFTITTSGNVSSGW